MITATLPPRGTDAWGSGEFGASRGSRSHKGIDYACFPETIIHTPVTGTVTKLGYPYGDDLSFRYVEVTTRDKNRHRLFYTSPEVSVGELVSRGDIVGTAQDIAGKYHRDDREPMTNHIHYEILAPDGTPINPEGEL